MERIITTEGLDITDVNLRILNRTVNGVTIDGDAMACAERAERERRVRTTMLAAKAGVSVEPCVVCHWPAHECTCTFEVCS